MSTNADSRHLRHGARRATRTALAALATGALLLGACTDADDDTDAAGAAAGDADAVATGSGDTEALLGTWASPQAREMTFADDGSFTVTEGGDVLAEGTYTATPTTIELVPGSGAIACDEAGTYEWEVDGDTLTFALVEDPCAGRVEGLDGVPRERVETGSTPDAAGPEPIVGEFRPVDPGVWAIDTLGIPLELELTGQWSVQPNRAGVTVLTAPGSQGPADRDVVFFRPTGLVEPDRVNDSPDGFRSQEGWPLSDIDGWLDEVIPGLVDGEPVDTTLGGREAVRFDVEPADDFPCGPAACAGFITIDLEENTFFEPGQRRTIWWVDGGAHEPLVVMVGRDAGDTEWLATAETLLDTVELGEPGPHPIDARDDDADPVSQGEPGDVSAGQTVETPRLGGLRFVAPDDEFVYQAPGLVSLGEAPVVIDLVAVVETLDGEPIESVDTVVSLIEEASVTFDQAGTSTIAGHEARAVDFTAERTGEPRPDDAVFRFESGGVGGWGPIGVGRAWVSETPRGLLLYSVTVLVPGEADLAEAIADAETFLDTLELVDGETAS